MLLWLVVVIVIRHDVWVLYVGDTYRGLCRCLLQYFQYLLALQYNLQWVYFLLRGLYKGTILFRHQSA